MLIIKSQENENVRALKALYTKKARKETGKVVVEGVNIVKDLPTSIRVYAYYFAESRYEELAYVVKDAQADVFVLTDSLLQRVGETVTPSGVIAVVQMPVPATPWQEADPLLVLDGIADPGNMGTIMRTALAAGYTSLLLLGGVDPYSPKVVRSSMGGVFGLKVYTAEPEEFVSNHHTYLLDMKGASLFNVQPVRPYALVVGSEAKGACQTVRARTSEVLSIPMREGIESLNAGVAVSIAMYVINHNLGR